MPKNIVINIHIYPDIKTFHYAVNRLFGDWYIINNVDENIYMVSPLNPGTYHSSNSIKRAMLGSIATSLVFHKCEKSL